MCACVDRKLWDDYEYASYGQSVVLPFLPEATAEVYEANKDYPWIFHGKMAGLEDLEFINAEWYTPS